MRRGSERRKGEREHHSLKQALQNNKDGGVMEPVGHHSQHQEDECHEQQGLKKHHQRFKYTSIVVMPLSCHTVAVSID